MNRQEIEQQQEQLLLPDGPLYSRQQILSVAQDLGVLSDILNYDEETIRLALGDFGLRLRDFAVSIDRSHPEIQHVPLYENSFDKKCAEVLRLTKYAKSEGMNLCLEGISQFYTKNLPTNLRFLDTPHKNQQHVKLLPDRNARDQVRSTKSMRDIDLTSFYKRAQVGWDGLPSDFNIFIRNNSAYLEELEKAMRKAERYASLGCHEMSAKINEAIAAFQRAIEENYYGFHRITMTDAAVVLAKMNGFDLIQRYGEYQITVQNERIIPYQFDIKACDYKYAPRAYPLSEISVKSSTIDQIVDLLETFENGKAIFDHYVVIVPGVDVVLPDESLSKSWKFFDANQKRRDFEDRIVACEFLDTTLIQEKVITPILLGESDGKCYFICYFI